MRRHHFFLETQLSREEIWITADDDLRWVLALDLFMCPNGLVSAFDVVVASHRAIGDAGCECGLERYV